MSGVQDGSKVDTICSGSKASKKAACWKHFSVYNLKFHPDLRYMAVCNLCLDHELKKTEISARGGSTKGLNGHLKLLHRKEYDLLAGTGTSAFGASKCISSVFPKKPKAKTVDDLKEEHKQVTTNFIIANAQPLSIVNSSAYRNLFRPWHKDADKITNISSMKVRDNIFHLGKLGKRATMKEVRLHEGSWTTDHWTGYCGTTYSTMTYHYIDNDWNMCSSMIDFKVFSGSTTGKRIFDDCLEVLESYTSKENIILGVTDTVGSMGVLGQHLRDADMKHGYCTDHNFHLNAKLAFKGKQQQLLSSCYHIVHSANRILSR